MKLRGFSASAFPTSIASQLRTRHFQSLVKLVGRRAMTRAKYGRSSTHSVSGEGPCALRPDRNDCAQLECVAAACRRCGHRWCGRVAGSANRIPCRAAASVWRVGPPPARSAFRGRPTGDFPRVPKGRVVSAVACRRVAFGARVVRLQSHTGHAARTAVLWQRPRTNNTAGANRRYEI